MIESLVVFCDKQVGFETVRHLLARYREFVSFVVVTAADRRISGFLKKNGFASERIIRSTRLDRSANRLAGTDLFLLAWWPYILKKDILSIPRLGTINMHPSLLPYNRGKHYNFWSIVEESPFGVTLHFAEEAVDGGDIVAQKAIPKTWEDTGKSLYDKAQAAMVELMKSAVPQLLSGRIPRHPQPKGKGSFHYAREIDDASKIDLDKIYTARQLLNLLRARTFPPHPSSYFVEGGRKYNVTVKISEEKV